MKIDGGFMQEVASRASAIIDDLPDCPDIRDRATAKREICKLVEDRLRIVLLPLDQNDAREEKP